MTSASPQGQIAKPSSLACDDCRRRHLRCDAGLPTCKRCIGNGRQIPCVYTPSRRGLVRRSRKTKSLRSEQNINDVVGELQEQSLQMDTTDISPVAVRYSTPNTAIPSSRPPQSTALGEEKLINAFYLNAWPAHPFLVPRRFYAEQRYPRYLELIISDIGQHYSNPAVTNSMIHDAAVEALSSPDETTIHRVQALLLSAILFHADHQPRKADEFILRAAAISDRLGMHHTTFTHGLLPDTGVAAESYRRVWWELYTIDAYVAGLHHRQRYLNAGSNSNDLPLLPCSQTQYESGQCESDSPSILTFEQRVFLDSPLDFSPHCYRIEAARLMDRVLSVSAQNDARPDDVQAVDNALASWKYNLPSTHPDVITSSGEVDQALFQAHYYVACASIFLHFPRSDLPATVPSTAQIACAKEYPQLSPTSAQHTIKAIAASKELSNLAAIPWPMDRHSPLFTCALILACIVQLAAATIHHHQCGYQCLQHHRDRVVLIIGALRHLGTKWSVASDAAAKLKPIANMIFTTQQHRLDHDELVQTPHNVSLNDSGLGMNDDLINVSWFDLFDPAQLPGGSAIFDDAP